MVTRRTGRRAPSERGPGRSARLRMLVVGGLIAVLLVSCTHPHAFEPPMTEAILYGSVTDETGAPVPGFRTISQDFDTDCARTITAPDTAVSNDASGHFRHVVFAQYGQCERLVIEPIDMPLLRPDTLMLRGVPWRHSYPLDSLRVDAVLRRR